MHSLKRRIFRILLSAVSVFFILSCLNPVFLTESVKAADSQVQSSGTVKVPSLTADSTQNVVRNPVDVTFQDDAAWRAAINAVSVDGVSLDVSQYDKNTAGKITIDKSVFKISKDYNIVIKANGHSDAAITQTIGLFYITGDGVSKEIVFTRAELEAMEQKKVLFSATNDFPEDLLVAAEGVPLKALLEKAGIKLDARLITFRGTDGYIGEYMVDQLLNQKRFHFPDKNEVEPLVALKRMERTSDFAKIDERDTPVLCFGQRAQTEQTLLGFVKVIQSVTVTANYPETWTMPTAKIIDPATGKKAAIQGGTVKKDSKIALEGAVKTKIYFTTDGTEPNLDSRIFNEHGCGPLAGQDDPIVIDKDTTIKAKAVWMGKLDSGIASYSFTVSGDTQASVQDKTFSDIQDNWAKEDIELLASKKVISGRSGTSFDPGGCITRAEFAACLARALDLDGTAAAKVQFKDVADTSWYAGSVAAVAEKKIITGYDGGLFKPDQNITRQEMASMIARAASAAGKELTISGAEQEQQLAQFKDIQMISDWAKKDVALVVKAGIINGMPGGEFSPGAKADRAQSAAILKRLLIILKGDGYAKLQSASN